MTRWKVSDDMKDAQATVEFDHPCHETCSGWQQGYERGVYDGGYPDLIRNALDQRDEIAAERDKLRAEVEKLRGALEFYADPKNWRSTQKLRAPQVAEILEERGINLVRKRLDIAMMLEADSKLTEADRVYADLMKYMYAPRREEDAHGKTADLIAVPMTTDEAKDYIKAARS